MPDDSDITLFCIMPVWHLPAIPPSIHAAIFSSSTTVLFVYSHWFGPSPDFLQFVGGLDGGWGFVCLTFLPYFPPPPGNFYQTCLLIPWFVVWFLGCLYPL